MRGELTQIGFIRNGGQWPDTILALCQVPNEDVWFTKNGVVRDLYAHTLGHRVGEVGFEPVHEVQQSIVTHDTDEVQVTYIKGVAGASISTSASMKHSIRYLHSDGKETRFYISRNGCLTRSVVGSGESEVLQSQYRHHDVKMQDEVLAKTSSVFIASSYIGGPGIDEITAMRTLPDGTVLIVGATTQTMFPQNLGGYSRVLGGNSDGFIARVDGLFRKIYRWTFIGGSGVDRITGIALDKSRQICVVTQTDSYDMPVMSIGTTTKSSGGKEAHIAIIDSTMSKLMMGLYHGSTSDDIPCCISVDVFDDIVIAGTTTSSTGLPTTKSNLESISGYYESNGRKLGYNFQVSSGKYGGGKSDGFIAIYSNTGQLRAARYYGAEGNDTIAAMTTDKRGRIIFAGTTTSQNLTTVPIVFAGWPGRIPLLRSYAGGASDGFIVRMNRDLKFTQEDVDGNFVTYFGGTGTDRITSFDLGLKEDIFFGGSTTSNGFYKSSSIQSAVVDKSDGYIGWLRIDGTSLDGFTYWGGSADDEVLTVRADTLSTNVVIGGRTTSNDFPIAGAGSVGAIAGEHDGFLAALDFKRARFSTLISGTGSDEVVALTDAKYCDAVFAANTTSPDLPVTDSALMQRQSIVDGYFGRYSLGEVALSAPKDGEIYCAGSVMSMSWQTLGLSDTVRYYLEYRRFGGDSWTTIAKSLRTKSTSWTVPRAIIPGKYEVRVSTQLGHSSKTEKPITIDISPAVSVRSSPLRDCEGASVRMVAIPANVTATFQWRRNGTIIVGATDSVYVIEPLGALNVGRYDCVVGGYCPQSDTSVALDVGVTLRPVIRVQPIASSATVGEDVRLGVEVDGAGMSYQWYKDSVKIRWATSAQYIITKAVPSDSGLYWCAVTNACGTTISDTARVSVRFGTSVQNEMVNGLRIRQVSQQPANDELCLEFHGAREQFTISLLDLRGRLLTEPLSVTATIDGYHQIAFPVSRLSAGVILVTAQSQVGIVCIPVMIAH